jgi:hypothetical protein
MVLQNGAILLYNDAEMWRAASYNNIIAADCAFRSPIRPGSGLAAFGRSL